MAPGIMVIPTFLMKIPQPLILMMNIPLDMRQIDSPEGSGYYSKSAPATDLNSTRTMNSVRKLLFLQYPRKAGGQVTVAATVTAIMTNRCSSQKEKNFTQVKAESFRDFSNIQCSFQPI